jgi:signal transduction histidine kinase
MLEEQASPLVLVVDDQAPATVMLQRLFEHHGYRVKCAYDGPTALDIARDFIPDLILLDVLMPGMSGFEVLERLRQNPVTAIIPTIMITALDEPESIARGLNLGADDYMRKPYHTRELLARAESKMKARKLEDNLQRRTQELEALLRVSEELNQRREVNELLKLVTRLTLELLPGDVAAIFQLNEEGSIVNSYIETGALRSQAARLNVNHIVEQFLQIRQPMRWNGEKASASGFKSGMVIPLQHGDITHGILMVLSLDTIHDERHLRLFEGTGRQAGLALRNAELYEIQMNYALHLEDMVAEQTSELRSAQQLLIRQEKLASIGHLAASIAHEINNPLQPIVVILDDMRHDIEMNLPPDIRALEIIQQSVERIRRIVAQLLDFTGKRSAGSELQPLRINDILEGIVTLNRKFFQQNKINIEANLHELPLVHGSKDKLEQVFMNLAINAQAAMPKGGTLYVNAYSEGENVVIEFIDTGHGIAPQHLDKIFDPFFTTKQDGTGLGLFVSYGIIQSHNGSITVESEAGKGTRFIIRLPVTLNVA